MPTIAFSFAHLSAAQLLTEVHSLVACERQATGRLVASLAELETRGLHLAVGCSSLFTYCTQRLHLSEAEAYSRIGAARAARKWPLILELLADGSITLTTVNRPQRPGPSRTGSRHVPAAVRREVWRRDDGHCAFVGPGGRCSERGFLEFHHVRPFAEGRETTAANLELRCRAHNAYESTLHFGTLFVRERLTDSVQTELAADSCPESRSGMTPGLLSAQQVEHPRELHHQ